MRFELIPGTEPIYRQIVEQVQAARARGELPPGEPLPPVRELAERLGINRNTVAHAYRLLRQEGVIVGRAGGGTRVAEPNIVSQVGHTQLWHRLEPVVRDALANGTSPALIEATVQQAIQHWRPFLRQRSPSTDSEVPVRCLGSHDFCLDLLARRLRTTSPNVRLICTPVGSTAGLIALGRGEAHLAGVHLLDTATGEYNRPFVNRLVPDVEIRLVTLVHREQGLIVRRGNPLQLYDLAALARPGVRFADRQAGSGTHLLLDYLLAQHGLTFDQITPTRELTTHLAVAAAVASGGADAGIGVRTAACALDLDFVPLATERYDLAFRRADETAPWLAPLLETLASPALRADIEGLEGYDATHTAWMN
jgi:molybdate-binding protein/DNA-binding transcriptional regulator YhcF (GntR family)